MGNKTSLDTLFKSRSTGNIIKSGYKLYTENFRSIFKASWHTAVLYSIACAILGTLSFTSLPLLTGLVPATNGPSESIMPAIELIITFAAIIIMLIAGGLFETAFYSRGISLLVHHSATNTIPVPKGWFTFDMNTAWRTLKAVLSCLAIAIVPATAFGCFWKFRLSMMLIEPSAHVLTLALAFTSVCIVAIILLPLAPISMKYVLNAGTRFWPLLAREYTVYLRRYTGKIIGVGFVCAIIITVVEHVTALPASVITMANIQAYIGMANGDPLGMPDYITALTAGTFFIAGFMKAYVRMSIVFVTYYLYGAIETDENGRRQMAETVYKTDNRNQTL